MGLASIFESFNVVCNCFYGEKKKPKLTHQYEEIDRQLATMNGKYDIHILKVAQDFHIKNLYPITDQVQKWSVFVVGNDKTYIHASVGEFDFPNSEHLMNKKGTNILSSELNEFFDPLWTQTLNGSQLQFYMSVSQKLFFVNTYPFVNEKKEVIGAIMFIRPFSSERAESRGVSMDGYEQRISIDAMRQTGNANTANKHSIP